jgi:hypothetical protein
VSTAARATNVNASSKARTGRDGCEPCSVAEGCGRGRARVPVCPSGRPWRAIATGAASTPGVVGDVEGPGSAGREIGRRAGRRVAAAELAPVNACAFGDRGTLSSDAGRLRVAPPTRRSLRGEPPCRTPTGFGREDGARTGEAAGREGEIRGASPASGSAATGAGVAEGGVTGGGSTVCGGVGAGSTGTTTETGGLGFGSTGVGSETGGTGCGTGCGSTGGDTVSGGGCGSARGGR